MPTSRAPAPRDPAVRTRRGPGVLDALSLLAQVTDEVVVSSARDTHLAWLARVESLVPSARGVPSLAHRGIAGGVYAGLGAGLRGLSWALERAADAGVDGSWPRLEDHPRGRFVVSAVDGLIGDRLQAERPRWAVPMSVRVDGADVGLDSDALASAYPGAGRRLVVFLHGLCENESHWERHRDRRGTTYAETLAAAGWTPVLLRANTGLPLRQNGAALAALMQRLVDAWPVPVERIALVGHSMGGLVFRAAAAVVTTDDAPWAARVRDVVTLGTPHLGSPVAVGVGHGSRTLGRLPESAAFGRVLDQRSRGVVDLVEGLGEDVPALPHARYRLVSGSVGGSERHPLGVVLGDGLVRPASAHGRAGQVDLFPGAEVLHVSRAGHFDLLNHPQVERALLDWLA